MDRTIIEKYNSIVRDNDLVYHLGDFSLSAKAVENILPELKGHKMLIKGNHDKCHPVHCRSPEKLAKWDELYLINGFKELRLEDRIYIGDRHVNMHHMPYFDETDPDLRYKELRPVDKGEWLLHGHVHTSWKTKGRQINVGVDMWDYAPVSWEQIKAVMDGQ
jgi:calcineurin-like phosphoesterase family protein